MAFAVNYGQLLDFVFLKYGGRLLKIGRLTGGHEIFLRHYLVDRTVKIALEAQVAVGHDTHQQLVAVYHGYAADMVFLHHGESVAHCATGKYRHRIVNHTVLGTLHGMHLTGLLGNRHILVDNANATLARYRDGKTGLGDGVHGGRHQRYIQCNTAGKSCGEINCARKHFTVSGNKEDVVKC